jgi:predicted MFS family arabinose efflux permease
MGMASLTIAPLAAWLASIHDWRGAMLIIAAITAALIKPAAMLVRRPPALQAGHTDAAAAGAHGEMTVK